MASLFANIPPRLLMRLGLFGLAGFVLLVGFNLPMVFSQMRLASEIARMERELARQNVLFPVYAQLNAKARRELPEALPTFATSDLEPEQIDTLASMLTTKALDAGLSTVSVNPEASSLEGHPGYLSVEAVLSGPFTALRDFLLDLLATPSLAHIQHVTIGQGAEQLDYRLRCWFHLAASPMPETPQNPAEAAQ